MPAPPAPKSKRVFLGTVSAVHLTGPLEDLLAALNRFVSRAPGSGYRNLTVQIEIDRGYDYSDASAELKVYADRDLTPEEVDDWNKRAQEAEEKRVKEDAARALRMQEAELETYRRLRDKYKGVLGI
jgi:hypothetical protein